MIDYKTGDTVKYTYTTPTGGCDTVEGKVISFGPGRVLVDFPALPGFDLGKPVALWLPYEDVSYVAPTYNHCQEPHCSVTFAPGSTAWHTGICWECLTRGLRIAAQQVEHLTFEVSWRSRSDFEETLATLPRYEADLVWSKTELARLQALNTLAEKYR